MGSRSLLKVVITNIDILVGPFVTLVYPLYASIRAIETKSLAEDKQWLMYWVLYSLITIFELTFGLVIEWIPLWSYAKFLATCWLVLPYFSGAAYVYQHYVRPFVVNPHTTNILQFTANEEISSKSEVLHAAEKYIEENGPEAFEMLITKAERTSKSRNSSCSMLFDLEAKTGSVFSSDYYDHGYSMHDDYRDYRYSS